MFDLQRSNTSARFTHVLKLRTQLSPAQTTHPNRIPFALATSLGLAALAMQLPITADEAGAGLVPPATALFVLGKGGATLILIMLFMAVTSTGSAELIAVSSLVSYDVYRAYINPQATGEQILKVSRYTVFIFGALMGVLSIGLNELGLSLGWVYLFMGIVIGSAVVPVSMVLTWKKATAKGAIAGAILGQICAIIAWLVSSNVVKRRKMLNLITAILLAS